MKRILLPLVLFSSVFAFFNPAYGVKRIEDDEQVPFFSKKTIRKKALLRAKYPHNNSFIIDANLEALISNLASQSLEDDLPLSKRGKKKLPHQNNKKEIWKSFFNKKHNNTDLKKFNNTKLLKIFNLSIPILESLLEESQNKDMLSSSSPSSAAISNNLIENYSMISMIFFDEAEKESDCEKKGDLYIQSAEARHKGMTLCQDLAANSKQPFEEEDKLYYLVPIAAAFGKAAKYRKNPQEKSRLNIKSAEFYIQADPLFNEPDVRCYYSTAKAFYKAAKNTDDLEMQKKLYTRSLEYYSKALKESAELKKFKGLKGKLSFVIPYRVHLKLGVINISLNNIENAFLNFKKYLKKIHSVNFSKLKHLPKMEKVKTMENFFLENSENISSSQWVQDIENLLNALSSRQTPPSLPPLAQAIP